MQLAPSDLQVDLKVWNSSRQWASVYILVSSCLWCKSLIETEQNVLEHKFYSVRRAAGVPRGERELNCSVFSPEAHVRVSHGVCARSKTEIMPGWNQAVFI